jgi:hypothetical protein
MDRILPCGSIINSHFTVAMYSKLDAPIRAVYNNSSPQGIILYIQGLGDWIYFDTHVNPKLYEKVPRIMNHWEQCSTMDDLQEIVKGAYDHAETIMKKINYKERL